MPQMEVCKSVLNKCCSFIKADYNVCILNLLMRVCSCRKDDIKRVRENCNELVGEKQEEYSKDRKEEGRHKEEKAKEAANKIARKNVKRKRKR